MRRPKERRRRPLAAAAAALAAAAAPGPTTATDAGCAICAAEGGGNGGGFDAAAPLALPPPFDFVRTCGAFEVLAGAALDEAQCRVVRRMGSLCGCGTRTEDSCHLCGDDDARVPSGFKARAIDVDAAEVAALDPDLGAAFAMGLAPSCEMTEAYLFSVDGGDGACGAFRDLVGSQCGCGGAAAGDGEEGGAAPPTPEEPPAGSSDEPSSAAAAAVAGTCDACPGGVADPDEAMDIDFMRGLLGSGQWTCGAMEAFATSLSSDSLLCTTFTAFAYLCGCNDGVRPYLGADTVRGQAALAWIPRASGLLSVVGSSLIIRDVARNPRNLRSLRHQLILGMSVGDVINSAALSLSTLPIPKYHPTLGIDNNLYGAEGNEATCTAQGFFVQLGYTSVFFNLALSTNYLLTIKYGMRESQINRYRLLFLLPPPLVGLALALAGIPFYDSIIMMCHVPPPYSLAVEGLDFEYSKTSTWGPIVALSIVPLTISMVAGIANMIAIYCSVRRQERRATRWRHAAEDGHSISRPVLMQALLYTASFLLCWSLYFVANFRSDELWDNYAFWASLALLSPLMGFCNCLVYFRPRMAKAFANWRTSTRTSWRVSTRLSSGWKKRASKEGARAGDTAGTSGCAQEAPGSGASEVNPEKESN